MSFPSSKRYDGEGNYNFFPSLLPSPHNLRKRDDGEKLWKVLKSGWDWVKVSDDFRGGRCVIDKPDSLSSSSWGFAHPSSHDPRPTGLNFGQTRSVVSLWCKPSVENLNIKCPSSHGKNASRHDLPSFCFSEIWFTDKLPVQPSSTWLWAWPDLAAKMRSPISLITCGRTSLKLRLMLSTQSWNLSREWEWP